ncbi:MAG: division/cell wall cluster transcriptional repressor MraZ [Eubacteriales bacterium]|nr:division/cell wall cluster transcriptional repressor MraZ [Eubacteriales bacterium]
MFIGEYRFSMDSKGRISIPTKFREELGEVFYITKGFDSCLFVYSAEEWEAFMEKLNQAKLSSKNSRKIQRFFLAASTECSTDKQGRVLLSGPQREYAGIEKEVVVIGVSNRIEIWAEDTWKEYVENEESDISDIADSLEDDFI